MEALTYLSSPTDAMGTPVTSVNTEALKYPLLTMQRHWCTCEGISGWNCDLPPMEPEPGGPLGLLLPLLVEVAGETAAVVVVVFVVLVSPPTVTVDVVLAVTGMKTDLNARDAIQSVIGQPPISPPPLRQQSERSFGILASPQPSSRQQSERSFGISASPHPPSRRQGVKEFGDFSIHSIFLMATKCKGVWGFQHPLNLTQGNVCKGEQVWGFLASPQPPSRQQSVKESEFGFFSILSTV